MNFVFFLDVIHRLRTRSNKITKGDNKQMNVANVLHKLTFKDLNELVTSDFGSKKDMCGVPNGPEPK